jgi:lipopolysaccharide/colanic/teichoic acid biosynthesis glycosyltransferase
VIRGEMSLVGPRPIVNHEVEKYAEEFDLYLKGETRNHGAMAGFRTQRDHV